MQVNDGPCLRCEENGTKNQCALFDISFNAVTFIPLIIYSLNNMTV